MQKKEVNFIDRYNQSQLLIETKKTLLFSRKLASHSAEATLSATREALSSEPALSRGLTAEELSRRAGVSVVLARERLLAAEAVGAACRDDSVEGIRFYHNRILLEA